MKKVLTKILGIIFLTLALIIKTPKLDASSGQITLSSNKYTALVGTEISVSVTISSGSALGAWEYVLDYDTSKLKLTSGNVNVVLYGDGNKTSSTEYYTFKVLAQGTTTIRVKNASALSWDDDKNYMSLDTGSVRINGITQAELEASYSKNNNLESLKVEGYELSPVFNKDTLSYTVSVPSNVEKVKISGSVEDGSASASGFGEFDVSEGDNNFEIVVTAQNGGQKKYTLKVTVVDENPIEVKIDNKKYTVVKRESSLKSPATYEKTTQFINGIEVPAFKSTITNYVLVGLKSEDGKLDLYIYNENENSYTLYKEIKTEGIVIFPKKANIIPDYYKVTKIKINEEEVEAYQYDGIKDYYLIYGVNIENNEEGFYEYDVKNNTITRYNDEIIKELTKKNENYLMIIIVLGIETIILLIILIIIFISNRKLKKRLKQENKNKELKKEKNKKEEKNKTKEKTIENKEEIENKKNETSDKKDKTVL